MNESIEQINVPHKPEAEKLGWTRTNTEYRFRSHWYNVRQDTLVLPQHTPRTFTYIEHPGAVFVIPVTSDMRFMLMRSYRYPSDRFFREIPAGSLGDHVSSTPEDVAARELREEMGASCEQMTLLGKYYMYNGISDMQGYFFLATGVSICGEPELEELEAIDSLASYSPTEIKAMIRDGAIDDGETVFGLLLALDYLDRHCLSQKLSTGLNS